MRPHTNVLPGFGLCLQRKPICFTLTSSKILLSPRAPHNLCCFHFRQCRYAPGRYGLAYAQIVGLAGAARIILVFLMRKATNRRHFVNLVDNLTSSTSSFTSSSPIDNVDAHLHAYCSSLANSYSSPVLHLYSHIASNPTTTIITHLLVYLHLRSFCVTCIAILVRTLVHSIDNSYKVCALSFFCPQSKLGPGKHEVGAYRH